MSNRLVVTLAVCGALASASSGKAQQQQPMESYVAFLSEADHFNSSGERLRTAAAIIRQDRANFHRFGRRDQADESDSFFADAANREALEQMLEHGHAAPGVPARAEVGQPPPKQRVSGLEDPGPASVEELGQALHVAPVRRHRVRGEPPAESDVVRERIDDRTVVDGLLGSERGALRGRG